MRKKLLFLICFIAVVLSLLFLFVRFYKRGDNVVAPYYEKQVFQKPPDIEKEATVTARVNDKMRLPIVMYHYVEYVQDAGDLIRKRLNITPDSFERQLKMMKAEGFETYFVKDVPDFLHAHRIPSEKPIILTFDDGYEDFYTVAFPILQKYKMKSTIYIMYNYIGRKGYLTHQEIAKLIQSGLVEIGSHTLDHSYLKHAQKAASKREIVDNKRKLEERFGVNVSTFAYPYGAFDKETVSLVKEASYSAAVSVISGMYQSESNLFYLSRIRAGALSGRSITHVLEGIHN